MRYVKMMNYLRSIYVSDVSTDGMNLSLLLNTVIKSTEIVNVKGIKNARL